MVTPMLLVLKNCTKYGSNYIVVNKIDLRSQQDSKLFIREIHFQALRSSAGLI